jgi:hypothetical protein
MMQPPGPKRGATLPSAVVVTVTDPAHSLTAGGTVAGDRTSLSGLLVVGGDVVGGGAVVVVVVAAVVGGADIVGCEVG